MSVTRLDTPFTDGGIHATNFFNGRVLSREDMKREQDHEKAIHERLGLATGDGIVWGLTVTAKAIGGSSVSEPLVTVSAGLAVNPLGQTIALDRGVDVALKKATGPQSTGTALSGSFDDCEPAADAVYVVGSGVYLLTVAPAQTRQGLALVSGLGNEGASCNVKEIVEGVQFRLYQVSENVLGPTELADEAHLRNVAAYKFFFAAGVGTDAVRDPFGTAPAAQSLTKTPVDDCDVPLALLHWTVTDGLRWVDLWSVRRRLAVADQSSFFPGARAAAVGEAMIRQFDEQVRSMRSAGTVFVRAGDTFRWLPPVGRLPLDAGGLSAVTFFTGFNTREVFIEGARVPSMLRLGASFPPFDVAATDPEMIWLYDVRENRQPFAGLQTAHRYLWFALGHLPYQGTPRFDVSRWDFANYALGVELAAT